MPSIIKSKKPIKFGKLFIINQLSFSEDTINSYRENIKQQNPQISDENLERELLVLLKRDSFYNRLMDEVASAYDFELDEEEVKDQLELLKSSYPSASEENLRSRIEISIYKRLIYEDLEKDWEIEISDEEVKDTLTSYYKSTGQSIREYLQDKSKFENVRSTLKEQLIFDRLMNAFAVEYRFSENEHSN
ncbi:uncharacterized protein MG377-like [Rattus rattus]|uniref:uncharacterized protein MG377-like n=1 Tax=Rattus rattus TaxID=10117 RepID=UPI0013F2EFF9|nr:uncharacterized protein MG377-like [Rattus rattus]